MNTKALIATLLVLGSTTVALADPMVSNGGVSASVTRDHRDADDGAVIHPIGMRPVWSTLSASDQLVNNRASVRVYSTRRLTELRLTSLRGSTEIEKIQIKFADGQSQIVSPDQTINASSPSLTVNLPGAERIKAITVFGHASRRASFEILGA